MKGGGYSRNISYDKDEVEDADEDKNENKL